MAESKTEEMGIVPIHSIDRKREPTNERDEGEGVGDGDPPALIYDPFF